jgi:predicted alpha-1,2-mannosidase
MQRREMLMTKRSLSAFLILLLSLAPVLRAQSRGERQASHAVTPPDDFTRYVNPFIGTANSPLPDYLGGNGSGNTFPGAALPFGMVQWGPDTEHAFGKDERGSYLYADTAIRGFSLTHLSGPGCPVFGDVPVMPFAGRVMTSPAADPARYLARFSHANERAAPGFYEVTLDTGVRVQLSATERTGYGVFTFPSGGERFAADGNATLLFDVGRNASGVSDARVSFTDSQTLVGSVTSGGFCGARNKYTLYFAAEFDRPFKSFGVWKEKEFRQEAREAGGAEAGAYVTFDATSDARVQVRVGLSYVSTRGALSNLAAENPRWDFEQVRARARARWNDALGHVAVRGGTPGEILVF